MHSGTTLHFALYTPHGMLAAKGTTRPNRTWEDIQRKAEVGTFSRIARLDGGCDYTGPAVYEVGTREGSSFTVNLEPAPAPEAGTHRCTLCNGLTTTGTDGDETAKCLGCDLAEATGRTLCPGCGGPDLPPDAGAPAWRAGVCYACAV